LTGASVATAHAKQSWLQLKPLTTDDGSVGPVDISVFTEAAWLRRMRERKEDPQAKPEAFASMLGADASCEVENSFRVKERIASRS
jgi:hypothetical protein